MKDIHLTTEISRIPIGTLAGYDPERLHDLLAGAREELERAKTIKQWLEAAIALKYEERIRAKRLRLEKDSGIVHLEDGGYRLSSEIAKRVEWDQQALTKVAGQILLSGGIVSDYMQTHYKIKEVDYKKWPTSVQALFAPARIIRLGNPTYELIKLSEEVAP
jgi:hypothetical protein